MPSLDVISSSQPAVADIAATLLCEPVLACERLPHAGNNQTLRLMTASGTYAAKCYFHSAEDPRDRLHQEWEFLQFAQQEGIANVPKPIAKDARARLALYSFMEGSKPHAVDRAMVQQAAALVRGLNRYKQTTHAQALADASESCFSAAAHLALLRSRIDKLQQAVPLPASRVAFEALREEIEKRFKMHAQGLLEGYARLGILEQQALSHHERILSPSDFGFHNSLKTTGGRLSFIDFEYAGWDDPAKMLSDFFLHPGVPVALPWAPDFWEAVKVVMADPDRVLARAKLLYPLLGLKWCCIILNAFIPEWAARRQFSDQEWEIGKVQAEQLEKAEALLYRLGRSPFG